MMIAYVDESAREGPQGVYYLMTAGVVLRADADRARTMLTKLLLPGQDRFHWRNERDVQRRMAMLEVVTQLGVGAFVSWDYPVGSRRQEIARGRCLTSLLSDLGREGVDEVVIEARETRQLDRQDALTISAAREAGLVPESLTYRFGRPKEEPLLWVADAIAGAVGEQLVGRTNRYHDVLVGAKLLVLRCV